MNIEPHTMTQTMHIAFSRFGIFTQSHIAARFKKIIRHRRVTRARRIHLHRVGGNVEHFENIVVNFFNFGRGVTHAPRPREIKKVAAARFRRKNIEHNRFA